MLAGILFLGIALFLLAYRYYGALLEQLVGIAPQRPTPSHADFDGQDRVPTNRWVLLGHHFSSIAGAGPIVGPIIAAVAYGWGPAFLWIVLGSIFIGGVHDFLSLMASVRNRGRSIADVARLCMSPFAWKVFLVFIWFTLVYVLTVFVDMTAATFTTSGAVASSSLLYLLLAVALGLALYRLRVPVAAATAVVVPLVFLIIVEGFAFPLRLPDSWAVLGEVRKTWSLLLLAYCFVASVVPVWSLLQPRDYLSSFLLYAAILGGLLGIAVGGLLAWLAPTRAVEPLALTFPLFRTWFPDNPGPLFPFLFITVACGACSGFHSLVSSGTTAKQLDRETDARFVGYGAMLIEGTLALIALLAVASLTPHDPAVQGLPTVLFASGMSRFLHVLGLSPALGQTFGLLVLSAFLLTTLDTATRLSRYVVEEFFALQQSWSRYAATLLSLDLPVFFSLITLTDKTGQPMPAWKAIWPVFGATNQLLAALALAVATVWLRTHRRPIALALGPALFMAVMTLWSLGFLIRDHLFAPGGNQLIGAIALLLLLLALAVFTESARFLRHPRPLGDAPSA